LLGKGQVKASDVLGSQTLGRRRGKKKQTTKNEIVDNSGGGGYVAEAGEGNKFSATSDLGVGCRTRGSFFTWRVGRSVRKLIREASSAIEAAAGTGSFISEGRRRKGENGVYSLGTSACIKRRKGVVVRDLDGERGDKGNSRLWGKEPKIVFKNGQTGALLGGWGGKPLHPAKS